MNIFVTGTDTGVGKTVVTAGLAAVMQGLGYAMGVYKPVQSGAELLNNQLISPDLEFVKSVDSNILTRATYNLTCPSAPSLAAMLDDVQIHKNRLIIDYETMRERCDFVITEGAGGILVPIYEKFLIRDLIKMLNLPVLIVARPNLGTINHTLLTVEAARQAGLDILGIVISNYPADTDDIAIKTAPDIISELSGVDVLGVLPAIDTANPEAIIDMVINNLDVQKVFNIKIPKLCKRI